MISVLTTLQGLTNFAEMLLDFDITSTVMIPLYALPDGKSPLEIRLILVVSGAECTLRFVCRKDVFAFQRALTGFRVEKDYAQ